LRVERNKANLKIHGNSMLPLIRDQDELEVIFFDKPKDIKELNVGEVVLIKNANEWIVHRILLTQEGLSTKGDWSMFYDSPSLIWGKVTSINGISSQLLRSKTMSLMSNNININKKIILRKFYRFKLVMYVFMRKFLKDL
jgi:hypothetical protein